MPAHAILVFGFSGGLRRSEILSLDRHKDDTLESGGWIDILNGGALITLCGKNG